MSWWSLGACFAAGNLHAFPVSVAVGFLSDGLRVLLRARNEKHAGKKMGGRDNNREKYEISRRRLLFLIRASILHPDAPNHTRGLSENGILGGNCCAVVVVVVVCACVRACVLATLQVRRETHVWEGIEVVFTR